MIEQAVQEIIDSYGKEIDQLQAELAAKDANIAALQAQCENYAAELIGERGENARLRSLVAKMEQYATTGEWSGGDLAHEAQHGRRTV